MWIIRSLHAVSGARTSRFQTRFLAVSDAHDLAVSDARIGPDAASLLVLVNRNTRARLLTCLTVFNASGARGTPTGFPHALAGAAPPPRKRSRVRAELSFGCSCSARSANRAPGHSLSLVCFTRDLERQEGRFRRYLSLKTPSLASGFPPESEMLPRHPLVSGEQISEKQGGETALEACSAQNPLSPPSVPRWGKRAKSRFLQQYHFQPTERKSHGRNPS